MTLLLEPRRPASGFSLVEVVLALGIVAFTVTVSVGLISTLLSSSRESRQRNELTVALDSLQPYLQDDQGFITCYGWAAGGTEKELLYVSYRADTISGIPKGGGGAVRSLWLDPASPPPGFALADLDAAREGRWVRARLTYSTALMPADTTLPSSVDDFPLAFIAFDAALAVVAEPTQPMPTRPSFRVPIAVNR